MFFLFFMRPLFPTANTHCQIIFVFGGVGAIRKEFVLDGALYCLSFCKILSTILGKSNSFLYMSLAGEVSYLFVYLCFCACFVLFLFL